MTSTPKSLIFLGLIFCLNCAAAVYDYDYGGGLEDLGDRISKSVQQRLKHLDNLGDRINANVQMQLRPLDNLGASISTNLQTQLRPLDNLGASISQQVHEGLRPVREMESRFKIKFGNGGTSVVTYSPSGKKFVVRNSALYVCDGTISETTGSCSGNLKRATFKTKKDFCYANVNSVINNWYCVGGGSVSAGIVNGKVFCNSNDGSPTLLISSDEYKNLCADVAISATYKYFTQQKLGEHGSDVQCSEGLPQVCTMSENLTGNFAGVSYVTIN
jgi:hypothetical protein